MPPFVVATTPFVQRSIDQVKPWYEYYHGDIPFSVFSEQCRQFQARSLLYPVDPEQCQLLCTLVVLESTMAHTPATRGMLMSALERCGLDGVNLPFEINHPALCNVVEKQYNRFIVMMMGDWAATEAATRVLAESLAAYNVLVLEAAAVAVADMVIEENTLNLSRNALELIEQELGTAEHSHGQGSSLPAQYEQSGTDDINASEQQSKNSPYIDPEHCEQYSDGRWTLKPRYVSKAARSTPSPLDLSLPEIPNRYECPYRCGEMYVFRQTLQDHLQHTHDTPAGFVVVSVDIENDQYRLDGGSQRPTVWRLVDWDRSATPA